ncbi:MAG: hypothetical protein CMG09_03565 [Candidatus Marinimicrobia bacterium]|nr:hypothetical protein [Candidatus Neomarinimicrobiota bacterium]|tara:strand:+ start:479 stop:787 length:309 start_codon:yes stop_codon:yes gene_type:complete
MKIKIKIVYNVLAVDDIDFFNQKISNLKNDYKNDFVIEDSIKVSFDLFINDKLVYTLDDHFGDDKVTAKQLVDKIDQQIYQVKSARKEKDSSKFDDLGLIDY